MAVRQRDVAVLCGVQVVDVLGVTVVITALPRMLATFGASPSMAGVVATSYAMSFGGLLMLGARLGDRLGHRRVLLAGLASFATASAMVGVAPCLAILVAGRCLQGAAAAASVPASLRMLSATAVDENERRRALGAWSAAGAAAGASGLVLGGVLTSLIGWRAVFLLNLPAALALAVMILRTVPERSPTTRVRLDGLGAALLTAALMGIILGAALLQQPRSRWIGVGLVGSGGALAALFAIAQRRAPEPLIPRAAVRERRLRTGAGAAFLNTATTSSVITLAALYLQDTRHVAPAAAGIELLPFSLCVVVGATGAGRRLRRGEPAAGLSAGLGLIAVADATTVLMSRAAVVLPISVAIAGLGIGISSVAATTIGTDVSDDLKGAAAGVLNSAAQLGTALGVSAAVLLAGVTQHADLPVRGTSLSWTLAALLAAGGALRFTSLRRPPHGPEAEAGGPAGWRPMRRRSERARARRQRSGAPRSTRRPRAGPRRWR